MRKRQDAAMWSIPHICTILFYENRWTFIMKKNGWVCAGILRQAGNKCQSSACMSV